MKNDWPYSEDAVGPAETSFDPGWAFDVEDLFENAVIALHVVGADGRILYANEAELALLRYSRQEYIGRPIRDFHLDPDVSDGILASLARGEEVRKVPARLRARDGSTRHVEITCNPHFVDGKFVHSRCFSVDVTELRHARAELEHKDQRFRQNP